jgi:hypothetical protein
MRRLGIMVAALAAAIFLVAAWSGALRGENGEPDGESSRRSLGATSVIGNSSVDIDDYAAAPECRPSPDTPSTIGAAPSSTPLPEHALRFRANLGFSNEGEVLNEAIAENNARIAAGLGSISGAPFSDEESAALEAREGFLDDVQAIDELLARHPTMLSAP